MDKAAGGPRDVVCQSVAIVICAGHRRLAVLHLRLAHARNAAA